MLPIVRCLADIPWGPVNDRRAVAIATVTDDVAVSPRMLLSIIIHLRRVVGDRPTSLVPRLDIHYCESVSGAGMLENGFGRKLFGPREGH